MALVDHYTDDTPVAFCDLSEYEQLLARDIEHDLVRTPLRSILHRRGMHTFIVTERSAEGVLLSFGVASRGYHHSKVQLNPNNSQCTAKSLRRAVENVCNEHDIKLVQVIERPISATKIPELHYAYTVIY